jgi:hypothetical protein
MILVCVSNRLNGNFFAALTIGKEYIARDLTKAKSYYINQDKNPWVFNMEDGDTYSIVDDYGVRSAYYSVKLFKPKFEIRQEKIDNIIYEQSRDTTDIN